MSTLLRQLRNQGTVRGRRWIVKRNTDNSIREVKCIFKPEEYEKQKGARPMLGDKALLKILEKESSNQQSR